LGSAAAGQVLSIQNTASKKVLQGIAVGPGQAAVGPEAAQLKADRAMGRLAYNR
jgi:flagella basal body P-ring formation protein FlgA